MMALALLGILWLLAGGGTTVFVPFVGYAEPDRAGVGSPYSDCTHILALGAGWYQDWGAWPPLCDQFDRPLAMVWSWHGGELPEVPDYAWGIQLGNEPNLAQQAGMSVAEAAEMSRRAAEKWPGRTLISPATYNDAYYLFQVYEWHERVYGAPPAWDVIGVHCYFATAQGCRDYIDLLRPLADNYDPPLKFIVSEWAILPCAVTTLGVRGQPDLARAQAEAGKLRAWFEMQPDILAHLWFASEYVGDEWCVWQPHPLCDTALMREQRLTEWGRWWTQGH